MLRKWVAINDSVATAHASQMGGRDSEINKMSSQSAEATRIRVRGLRGREFRFNQD